MCELFYPFVTTLGQWFLNFLENFPFWWIWKTNYPKNVSLKNSQKSSNHKQQWLLPPPPPPLKCYIYEIWKHLSILPVKCEMWTWSTIHLWISRKIFNHRNLPKSFSDYLFLYKITPKSNLPQFKKQIEKCCLDHLGIFCIEEKLSKLASQARLLCIRVIG